MTDNDKAPEWMTDEWLRNAIELKHPSVHFIREILRLRAELDRRFVEMGTASVEARDGGSTVNMDGRPDHLLPHVRSIVQQMSALRAELAKVTAERDAAESRFQAAWDACAKSNTERNCAREEHTRIAVALHQCQSERDAARAGEFNARRAMHDAEVDRNEFAASEVERLAQGWTRGFPFSGEALEEACAIRAAELRQAAGAPTPDKRGLHGKFLVERTDGSSAPGGKHDRCEYFVLDMTHDQHAVAAVIAYAAACRESRPDLAADMVARWGKAAGAAAPVEQCPKCDACSELEAETRCKPDRDGGGCPGDDLWGGPATPAADARQPAGDGYATRLIEACANVDWTQLHLNRGGCFHVEDGRICGRAMTWAGHGLPEFHEATPLYVAITKAVREAAERAGGAS